MMMITEEQVCDFKSFHIGRRADWTRLILKNQCTEAAVEDATCHWKAVAFQRNHGSPAQTLHQTAEAVSLSAHEAHWLRCDAYAFAMRAHRGRCALGARLHCAATETAVGRSPCSTGTKRRLSPAQPTRSTESRLQSETQAQ